MIQHKFTFSNIGIVKSAKIELNGLTVLTGLNDTGKSFLSKAIYSTIKSINNAQSYMWRDRYNSAVNGLNYINSIHRQFIPFTPQKQQQFNTGVLTQKFANYFINKQTKLNEDKSMSKEIVKYAEDVCKDLEETKNTLYKNTVHTKQISDSINSIKINAKRITQFLEIIPSVEDDLKAYFDRNVIQKLYQSQLNTLLSDSLLKIELEQGATTILTIEVENNSTKNFTYPNPLYLKDATIIETPTIVQLTEFITNTLAYGGIGNERADLPTHYQDLSQKLKIPSSVKNPENYSEIFNDIKNVIGGELKVKADENIIVFEKESGAVIKSINIATGIKSLGILQILLNSPHTNQNTLLIIDEPEVHLHPKWGIAYAKVIVNLCKRGITVVVSSHSGYFIEALSKYSDKELDRGITKFYFAKKENGASIFDDVTENLEPIFEALAKPIIELSKE